jgi:protein-S-isoprenylcysteine O-methyltransferase Ste14
MDSGRIACPFSPEEWFPLFRYRKGRREGSPTENILNGSFSRRIPSILARAVPASYFAIACIAFWNSFLATGKWTSLFWMVSEGVVVVLLVFRRPSLQVSRNPWDWFAGIAGSLLVLLVRPTGSAVAPDAVGFALQLLGTGFQLYGKLALGRSFGIVAANRGVVSSGPYRLVRHPIYLGYLVTHAGFLLSNVSARNVAIYGAAYVFQVARIFAEERILAEDSRYREYLRCVRYRLIPGVF